MFCGWKREAVSGRNARTSDHNLVARQIPDSDQPSHTEERGNGGGVHHNLCGGSGETEKIRSRLDNTRISGNVASSTESVSRIHTVASNHTGGSSDNFRPIGADPTRMCRPEAATQATTRGQKREIARERPPKRKRKISPEGKRKRCPERKRERQLEGSIKRQRERSIERERKKQRRQKVAVAGQWQRI